LLEDFPAPAPASPYGGSLASFHGISPNGTWRLYVYDYVYSDNGELDGWRLEFTTVTTDTIVLTDTLPGGMTILPPIDEPAGWQCTGTGTGELECETEYLGVDEPAVFTFVTTAPDEGGVLTNTAGITSTTTDIDPISNTTAITTTVLSAADVQIDKSVSPSVVYAGSPLTYTLSVSNAGPSSLLGVTVTVTDALPAGLTDVTVIDNGWMCDVAPLVVPTMMTCTLDTLVTGSAPDILVQANAPLTTGWITNTTKVASSVYDANMDNNTDAVGVNVIPPLLFIDKGATPMMDVTYHGEVTYTLVLTNGSGMDVSAVTVSDTLPSNTTSANGPP
jgi:uncharacterized repeat protein (TIGR01451 family)